MLAFWSPSTAAYLAFRFTVVLRVAPGPSVKLADRKSALNPPVVHSTDRSKAVVPVLVLLLVALWFILRGDCFMSYLVLFCSCVFQSF